MCGPQPSGRQKLPESHGPGMPGPYRSGPKRKVVLRMEAQFEALSELAKSGQQLSFGQDFFVKFYQAFLYADRWQQYIKGVGTTLLVTAIALVLGVVLGAIVAMIRVGYAQQKPHHRNPILGIFNAVAQVYVTVIRGTPMMVQLLIMSMVIFASSRNFTMVGALALGINSGAYVSEIIRGGLMAVDPGQMEAGRSLGLNYMTTMFEIIIPQAIRSILPALGNEFIMLLKDSSLITVIGGKELLAVIRLPKLERGPVSHGFVATLIVIMGYGLVMLFSASYSSGYANYGDVYHFIRPQGVIAVVGLVAMLIISNINYRALRYMNESFYIITVVLLIAALLSPEDTNGTYRWVYLAGGSFSLQPSELAKFSVMLWTADMLDRDHAHKTSIWYGLLKPALPLVPILVLLKLEPHNSAILLLCAIFGTMILCNGSAMRWWPMVGAAGAAGVIAFLKHLASGDGYAAGRLGGVWGLTPTNTAGMQWQTLQSIYAICTGGLFGVGIGNSVQKHQWLPYAENDFIFAVIGEELGFVGALALIALFAALLVQGVCIALRAPDLYGTLLGIGIISQVGWQVFLHIGVGTALLPNTGISLPFFSSGGTSLLLLLGEMGVMLSISRAGNAREKRLADQHRAETERILQHSRYRKTTV